MIFILFIAILFIFFYLNSRISTLEGIVRSEWKNKKAENSEVPQANQPVAQTASVVQAAQVPPVPNSPTAIAPAPENHEEWGGNWLAKIGTVAVTFGLLFFLQYAYEVGWITRVGLLMIGYISGLGLIALGAYFRRVYEKYGSILIGGGFALLFISNFVGGSLYILFSSSVALILALVIAAGATFSAVYYRSQALMVLGALGAYVSVFALGTGKESVLLSLGYTTVLSVGILVASVFKKWGVASWIGFAGTYLVYVALFLEHYTFGVNTALFAFFLTVFFLIYLINTVLHFFVRNESSTSGEISLIVLNGVISFFFYYILLVQKFADVTAYICLGYAIIYLLMAYLASVYSSSLIQLRNTLAGISALFLTVFIPLQFEGRAVTVGWLVLALGMLFISSRYITPAWRVFAVTAYVLALVRFFFVDDSLGQFFFNPSFGVGLLAVVVSYFGAWATRFWQDTSEVAVAGQLQGTGKGMSMFFFGIAHFLTLFLITREINHFYANAYDFYQERNAIISIVWTAYAVLLLVIGFVGKLKAFRFAGLIIFFLSAAKIFLDIWELGQVYRMVSSIVYGVVALVASFFYGKYKDRIKNIVS